MIVIVIIIITLHFYGVILIFSALIVNTEMISLNKQFSGKSSSKELLSKESHFVQGNVVSFITRWQN